MGTKEPRRLLFIEIGEDLFSDRWMKSMSIALGKDYKTIKRWVKGEHRVPDWAIERLIELMKLHTKCRANLLAKAKKEIAR